MPNEKFSMSLGTDSNVKVESFPVLKYHEQVGIHFRQNNNNNNELFQLGMISKHSSTSFEQKFRVKNSKSNEITLRIKHQIPRATEQNISVDLLFEKKSKTIFRLNC